MTDVMLGAHPSLDPRWAPPPRPTESGARQTSQRREYRAYFVLLFLLELPVALVAWSLRALRHGAWPAQGPLTVARSRAALVTSLILSV